MSAPIQSTNPRPKLGLQLSWRGALLAAGAGFFIQSVRWSVPVYASQLDISTAAAGAAKGIALGLSAAAALYAGGSGAKLLADHRRQTAGVEPGELG